MTCALRRRKLRDEFPIGAQVLVEGKADVPYIKGEVLTIDGEPCAAIAEVRGGRVVDSRG